MPAAVRQLARGIGARLRRYVIRMEADSVKREQPESVGNPPRSEGVRPPLGVGKQCPETFQVTPACVPRSPTLRPETRNGSEQRELRKHRSPELYPYPTSTGHEIEPRDKDRDNAKRRTASASDARASSDVPVTTGSTSKPNDHQLSVKPVASVT